MELTSIKITKFKKIKKLTLKLGNVNFLIGGNNSGKSSVLQAIHTAVSAAQTQLENNGKTTIAEEFLRYSPCADFSSLGHNRPFENRAEGNRAKVLFFAKVVDEGEELKFRYSVELYKARNDKNVGVNRSGSPRFGAIVSSLGTPFSIYVPGLAGIPHSEEYRTQPVVLRKLAGGEANLVLRNVILQIREEGKLEELIGNIKGFYPNIDIRVQYNPSRDTNISITVRSPGSHNYFPLELCGTGVLQTIQIFSYVALFKPTLLLLDEPDAHLHPSNQVKLLEAILFLSVLYGTKTIIATHSRHLMSAAQNDAKFHWLQNGKIKEDGEFELASVLMDIGGLDDADRILNSDKEFLFFIEDKIKGALKKLLASCGIGENRYDAIAYHGVSNAPATAKLLNSLRPFIRGNPKIIVHRDRDFLDDREVEPFRNAFEENGFSVFITTGSDIESYFINAEHIAYGTDVSVADIEQLIENCLEENDDEIRKRFKDKRREINRLPINRDGDNTPTNQLLPEDEWVDLSHVVGKDFCSMIRKMSQDGPGPNLNPEKTSNVCIAPDLVALLDQ